MHIGFLTFCRSTAVDDLEQTDRVKPALKQIQPSRKPSWFDMRGALLSCFFFPMSKEPDFRQHKALKRIDKSLLGNSPVDTLRLLSSVAIVVSQRPGSKQRLRQTVQTLRARPYAKVALSGHGGWNPEMGYVKIPPNTTLRFITPMGIALSNCAGRLLDTGASGELRNSNATLFYFGPGQWVQNVQLCHINRSRVAGSRLTVSRPVSLSELLYQLQGLNLDWSACLTDFASPLAIRPTLMFSKAASGEQNNRVYHGVFNRKTRKITKIDPELAQALSFPFCESPALTTCGKA